MIQHDYREHVEDLCGSNYILLQVSMLVIPSEELWIIHKPNYHDKWPTTGYKLQNDNTGFVFLRYFQIWLGDRVGGECHLPGYSVVPHVCALVCEYVCLVVVVGGLAETELLQLWGKSQYNHVLVVWLELPAGFLSHRLIQHTKFLSLCYFSPSSDFRPSYCSSIYLLPNIHTIPFLPVCAALFPFRLSALVCVYTLCVNL